MQETIEAVNENGVLRPLKPLAWLAEHHTVTLTVVENLPRSPFTDWVGKISEEDASTMMKVIEDEFEKVNPNGSP